MDKKILIILMVISTLLLTGCMKYGEGEAVGYISAVDDGIIWNKAWIKTSLEASSEDCYLVNNKKLEDELKNLENKQVKIYYKRHLFTASNCPEGTGTNDEIYDYKIINNTLTKK